jgi:hypothetical protein
MERNKECIERRFGNLLESGNTEDRKGDERIRVQIDSRRDVLWVGDGRGEHCIEADYTVARRHNPEDQNPNVFSRERLRSHVD